jgi:hypothetical protein
MTPNSLSPASAVISYHTLYGSHKMTVPTTTWFPTSITGSIGSYLDHDGDPLDAEVMWTAYCNLLKPIILTTTVFDSVTVYTQATPTSDNIPRASVALGITGTGSTSSKSQAQSATFNFKAGGNTDFKVVLLDQPYWSGGFLAQHPADFTADDIAFAAYITGRTSAIVARSDEIPYELRKITFDLNDKLQKAYRMGA